MQSTSMCIGLAHWMIAWLSLAAALQWQLQQTMMRGSACAGGCTEKWFGLCERVNVSITIRKSTLDSHVTLCTGLVSSTLHSAA